MNIGGANAHLTYCLNVHPGATPAELEAAVFERAPAVFRRLREAGGHGGPYGLGIWLSHPCAEWLASSPATIADFATRVREAGMYVFTVNGFPYGPFHGRRVKADVYRPDWSEGERVAHTLRLAELLAGLLPENETMGTISTVPVTYRAWGEDVRVKSAAANLAKTLCELRNLEERTGKRIQLLLEPEPDCLLDDAESVVAFFDDELRPALAKESLLRRYAGVCLDLSHAAVVFERPGEMLERLREHSIPVGKVHVSAAVRSRTAGRAPDELAQFTDAVYLHQTRVRTKTAIRRFADLPTALDDRALAGDWRVHYHVPLTWEGDEQLASTRDQIDVAFLRQALAGGVRHFEVETYTLPLFNTAGRAECEVLADELLTVQRLLQDVAE